MQYMEKLYIARDKDGTLVLFIGCKPWCTSEKWIAAGKEIILPRDMFADLTFADGPREVEINYVMN